MIRILWSMLDWENSNLFIYTRSQIIFPNKIFPWNVPYLFELFQQTYKKLTERSTRSKGHKLTENRVTNHLYEIAFQRLMHSDQHPPANGPIYQRIAWPIRRTIIADVPGVPRGNTTMILPIHPREIARSPCYKNSFFGRRPNG